MSILSTVETDLKTTAEDLARAEETKLQGYLANLRAEVTRLEQKIKSRAEGSLSRATAELHLAGVNREIEKLTPKPPAPDVPAAPPP